MQRPAYFCQISYKIELVLYNDYKHLTFHINTFKIDPCILIACPCAMLLFYSLTIIAYTLPMKSVDGIMECFHLCNK